MTRSTGSKFAVPRMDCYSLTFGDSGISKIAFELDFKVWNPDAEILLLWELTVLRKSPRYALSSMCRTSSWRLSCSDWSLPWTAPSS